MRSHSAVGGGSAVPSGRRAGHGGGRDRVSRRAGTSRRRARRLHAILLGAAGLLGLLLAAPGVAAAQDKAAGVFDDDGGKKPAEGAKATADGAKKAGAEGKAAAVSDRDSIGFTQENVAAQMTELEERMFRLSEAIQSLEPENASRLRLALKFSREELILLQMKDLQKVLKEAQLNKAETEVRELLAKLEHLRNLLLAEDLDFQMKLARLRQMREALAQLDRIIKEEKRELAWSRSATEGQKELEGLRSRRADLEALVRDQTAVIGASRDAGKAGDEAARKAARGAAGGREEAVRKAAARLAAVPQLASLQPPYLKQADPHLGDAVSLLGAAGADADEAVAAEEKALDLFRKELDRLNGRVGQTEKSISAAEFQRFEADQARNRGATDSLAETSARLGNTGIALQKDLIRAGGSMQTAEGDLAKTAAKPAADDQAEALKHLMKSRDGLAKAVESLLVELRGELLARIMAELTEMHDIQGSIRETTQAQAPRVAQRSRTALVLVVGLADKENELAERTEHLLALVEETQFGIALPTSLRVLAREMKTVRGWLKEGDASPRTVALEKRIEDDLLGLVEAMRRLPPTSPPDPGEPLPTEPQARERELNRLIAELKMIRLLQVRLNDDTITVDKPRAANPALTPALRAEIETLKAGQDEIRESIDKISDRLEAPEPEPEPEPVIPGLEQIMP